MPALLQSERSMNNGLDAGLPDDDPGLSGITGHKRDLGKFKAPSLRNIALTAPYMHDGRFRSLSKVIEFYSEGLRRHPNLDGRLQPTSATGWHGRPGRPVGPRGPVTGTRRRGTRSVPTSSRGFGYEFTNKQKRALLAFLKTLTDHELRRDPRFSDPFR